MRRFVFWYLACEESCTTWASCCPALRI